MNYAVVILVFVLLVALVYWFIAGRKYYVGPRTRAHVVNGMIVKDDSEGPVNDSEMAVTTGSQVPGAHAPI